MRIFTVLITIFYILGCLGVFFECELLSGFIALLVLVVLATFNVLGFKKSLFLYLIFFTGLLRAQTSSVFSDFMDEINWNNSKIIGRIVSSKNISIKNNKVKFYVLADEINVYNRNFKNLKEKVLVSLNLDNEILDKIIIGDTIEIKGKMRTPYSASNPYQFDYRKYLLNNDTRFILYGENETFKLISMPKLSKDYYDSWYYILKKFELTRNKIIEKHSKNIHSPRLEILGGIVFGNETINPDEKIKESFKNSGLLHLLAASGLNVALIYGIWWWIANLIRFPYSLSIFFGAIFVIFYTFMTGFPPSILRASLMLLFVLFGKLIDREADSISLIFFVGFLILLCYPKMLFDIGFQLSFMVTIGLIVCCPVFISKFDNLDKKFKEKYKKLSRFQKYILFLFSPSTIASVVMVPLVAQLWVIPLQMHYFNNFAPFSVLANIAVVPFIGILSFLGFVSSIIALIPRFSTLLVQLFDMVANPLLALLIKISNIFSSFKISLISTMGLNIFQIFAFWGLILLFTLNLKYDFKNKKHCLIFSLCLFLFLLSFIKFDYLKGELEVVAFDVGNADCFLIKTPKNKFILIDTGKNVYKSSTSAETIINQYFKNKRIKKLNTLIVTHFDSDHAGGVLDILENTKVGRVYIQKEVSKSQTSEQILTYLKKNKISYKVAKNNEEIYKEDDLIIKTFKPYINIKDFKNSDNFDNETSIITLLNYKDKNILFMADSGVVGFSKIEKYLPSKIDVLKIGHHGAQNVINKEMKDRINPNYAIISTGYNNFNHPHYSTVNFLYDNNIKTLSTKEYGFIKFIIGKDNNEPGFYHFDNEKRKIIPVLFDRDIKLPFDKTKYVQGFIESNI